MPRSLRLVSALAVPIVVATALLLASGGRASAPAVPGSLALAVPPSTPEAPAVRVAAVPAPDAPLVPPDDPARLAPLPLVPLGHASPAAWAAAPTPIEGRPPPEVSAAAVVVLDEASLTVLHAVAPHERRAPASLTKIATAILLIELGNLDDVVVSDVDAATMPRSSVMGLQPGDEFTLRDLLYGLMLPSGNDAAIAIARHLSGSERAFALEMTNLARSLGLSDTRFMNPHGLGSRTHYSSAYDLAVLARYLMSDPTLREVVAATSWTASGSRDITMRNVNSLLYSYEGADGVKTGFTRRAGKTYVGSVVRDGHRVYVVLLDAPNREADAAELFDWVFESYVWPEGSAGPVDLSRPPE